VGTGVAKVKARFMRPLTFGRTYYRMHQANPKALIDLLEVFRLGLHTGILDRQLVVEWADQLIMQEEAPDYFLIELSLGGQNNLNDFTGLLDKYVGENKPAVSKRAILGILLHQYKAGQITLQKAVRAIDWLTMHVDYSEEERSFMAGVDDDYTLADEGFYGNVSEVEIFLLRFLSAYKEFSLDNRQDWQKLNDAAVKQTQVLYHQLKTW
jgi:hypothetical protein